MKKIFKLTVIIMLVMLMGMLFVGCDNEINENTTPDSIVSDKVTKSQWEYANSYAGLKSNIYEVINELEYAACKSVSIRFWYAELADNVSDLKIIYKVQRVKKYDGTSNIPILDYYKWEGTGVLKFNDGKKDQIENTKGYESNITASNTTPIYTEILGGSEVGVKIIQDKYDQFYYDEDRKGYYNDDLNITVKFKNGKLVCYSTGIISFVFYNYDKTTVYYDPESQEN